MHDNVDDELAIAHEVTQAHSRFWSRIARQIAITLAVYALFAAVMWVSRWLSTTGSDTSPGPQLELTLSPESGATVMALLATIVIALNVAVWASRSTEISEVVAHTRRRYLSICGMATGNLAVLVGLAVLFHDAPGKVAIFSPMLLAGAFILSVVSSDVTPLLGKDIPVQRHIPEAEERVKIRSLAVVAAQWREPRRARRTHLTLWTALDIASIAVAALPLLALWSYRAAADHHSVDWWHVLGTAVGTALLVTFLSIYVIHGTVRYFVARRFTEALMTSMVGSLAYVLVVLSFIVTDTLTMASTRALTFLIPPILITFALATGVRRGVPGWTAKSNVHRSIVRDLAHHRSRRANSPDNARGTRLATRTRDWFDRVTGMTSLYSPSDRG